ncbi:MAG TPA: ATP-binding cassette domain-containing protein [Actinophytocola sp.]|uniref:ATP-binding cassette domain-containing protein n=1 Tax=Actinophytocola sp. TaxID=1872138 RepID=UPI002DBD1CE0|nr:ATP-binding cassette domain-containing protein [Actinophytocola sp.]HEU5475380.1 ATP-binding cassette domain-containing protein [Actinophytocola sp.]
MPVELALRADDLRKRYGDTVALDGFELAVPAGTVHALLGPNGAGKTTAVRILTTLTRPDGGRAEVAGLDVVRQARQVRTRIGLVGQHLALEEALSGRQNLELFARLNHLDAAAAARRAGQLLDRFGLGELGRRPAGTYSGGQRRRLDLAAGMILAPAVLFLDEPTTGLDPRGRNEVWASVRELVAGGTTVLLTTQYLDEADQLAGRISVLAAGRVIAEGSPEALKSVAGGDRLDLVLHDPADLPAATAIAARVAGAEPEVEAETRRVGVAVQDRVSALTEAVRALSDAGIRVEDIALRRPTLDEAFLHLTGKADA